VEYQVKESVAKNRQFKRGLSIIFLLSTIFLLSGCIEDVELDEKVIVALVGVDKTDQGTFRVTMGLINTRSIEEKEPHGIEVYSSEGDSIFEAVRTSILKLGRQPQWPYIKVLIFGPAFSEEDIVPVLDFFNRNNEVQPNPYISFSHLKAEEMIKLQTVLGNVPAVIVESQFKHQNLVGYAPEIELYEFVEMMLTPEKVGFAALIVKDKGEKQFSPKIEGTAVIKEGNWIGDLTNIETRGLLWVRDEVRGGIIVIPSIEGEGKIGLEILDQGSISIEPLLQNGNLSVKINLEQLVSISEVMTYVDLNEKNVEEIRQVAEKQIAKEIEATLQKSKEWKADIFGVNREVHKKYPQFYQKHKKDWGEFYSDLPIEINVHVDIKTMGLLRSLPSDN
jgi:spore germination protein KC